MIAGMNYYPSPTIITSNTEHESSFIYNDRKLVQLHWIGRFGNRMFQYVFGAHYAWLYNAVYHRPSSWEGDLLFKPVSNATIIPEQTLRLEINQTTPSMDNLPYRKEAVDRYNRRSGDSLSFVSFQEPDNYGKLNVCFDDLHMMYFPWIFNSYSSSKVKSLLQFRDEIVVTELYQYWYQRRGTYDAAHVRRGDIVLKGFTGSHSAISLQSYYRAMTQVGVDPKKVIWVSDDPNIRTTTKWHQYCHYDWKYPTGQVEIDTITFDFLPDFLAMIFARNLFRGNSSLSWWAGFLNTGTVYSPVLKSRVTCNERDFMECDFVRGNHPHFMGAKWEGAFSDIIFGHP